MAKSKFYVVWQGRQPGIYKSWSECLKQVNAFPGARYKSFETQAGAVAAYAKAPPPISAGQSKPKASYAGKGMKGSPLPNTICVDAACSGNPGKLEYRGVDFNTGAELFHMGPYPEGTVNIGEFLAIVHGLAWLKQQNLKMPIYSDSNNGIKWVREKNVRTTLVRSPKNESLFKMIDRALLWLNNNAWDIPVLKWETKAWGEIPADFGRK